MKLIYSCVQLICSRPNYNSQDFSAYLGSESDSDAFGSDFAVSVSGSDEDDDTVYLKKKARGKYQGLLEALKPEETERHDLKITFIPGLKDLGKKILNEKKLKDV